MFVYTWLVCLFFFVDNNRQNDWTIEAQYFWGISHDSRSSIFCYFFLYCAKRKCSQKDWSTIKYFVNFVYISIKNISSRKWIKCRFVRYIKSGLYFLRPHFENQFFRPQKLRYVFKFLGGFIYIVWVKRWFYGENKLSIWCSISFFPRDHKSLGNNLKENVGFNHIIFYANVLYFMLTYYILC